MAFLLSLFASLLLFLSAPNKKADSELYPYYKDFMAFSKKKCSKIETPNQFLLTFGTLKNDQIGLCYTYPFNKREIFIDESYWGIATEIEKRQLIYHELTHCILDKDHVNDAENYMSPYLFPLEEQELYKQLTINIEEFCNKD
jgi:hypothetical protein